MEGHRKRLKQRFLRAGIKGFTDREALELLLTYAAPRKDTRKLSEDLLDKFGSLKNILNQPPSSLMSVDGIGESAATLISLFSQLAARSENPGEKIKITGPDEVAEYLKKRLGSQRRERFSALLLNSANSLLAEVDLEYGTVNRTQVYPRNLVEKVIAHSAAGVILVHNHPGGKTDPSREDIALTRKLIKLGEDIDFKILDHFIVTENEIISLRAIGLLDR
ncbi:MAG: DNA repair protein RadC [Candidatus Fermentibacteria bacterium]|nr:DNA repair protein RadC [Candidatus Fermentibacteria bacterium]